MEQSCECPKLNEADWQRRKHNWGRRAFYRTSHRLLFHVPIGISGAIRKGIDNLPSRSPSARAAA